MIQKITQLEYFWNTYLTGKIILYSWTSLYAIDKDQKIWLAYNEFAYKKNKNDYKLGDMFQKNAQFAIEDTKIRR